MMVGSATLVAGLLLMGTIVHTTPLWHLSIFMVLMGLGTGALMQNLVLVVQNTVDVTDIGAASGVVSFFRSLGGTIGVAALGAVLATNVADKIAVGHGERPGSPSPAAGARARSTWTSCRRRWPRSCARRTPTRPGGSS